MDDPAEDQGIFWNLAPDRCFHRAYPGEDMRDRADPADPGCKLRYLVHILADRESLKPPDRRHSDPVSPDYDAFIVNIQDELRAPLVARGW
jgi:hypothetical protein